MQISKLQFITNYQSAVSHFDQVNGAVKGGVKWIQYRPKDVDAETILKEGKAIAAYCKQHSVIFIMNDKVDIALELNADGVHLGKDDMSPSEARRLLGNDRIIGGTSNTTEDIVELVNQGVNYVGLGPYRFTQTKKNLSPVLGLEGYKNIVSSLNLKKITIPIIAIGGIKEEDVSLLQSIGIHGVAVSSLMSEAESISLKAEELLKTFSKE